MKWFFCIPVAMALGSSLWYDQQAANPYSTGMTLLSSDGCPVFVGDVVARSPAERAGVRAGDQILDVGGIAVTNGDQAAKLFRSDRPIAVTARLARDDKEYSALFELEKRSTIYARSGKKIVSGAIVPQDTTDAEVERMIHFDGRRIKSGVSDSLSR